MHLTLHKEQHQCGEHVVPSENNQPQENLGDIVPFTGKGYPLYAEKEKHAMPLGT